MFPGVEPVFVIRAPDVESHYSEQARVHPRTPSLRITSLASAHSTPECMCGLENIAQESLENIIQESLENITQERMNYTNDVRILPARYPRYSKGRRLDRVAPTWLSKRRLIGEARDARGRREARTGGEQAHIPGRNRESLRRKGGSWGGRSVCSGLRNVGLRLARRGRKGGSQQWNPNLEDRTPNL